jgi:hypothetical protein
MYVFWYSSSGLCKSARGKFDSIKYDSPSSAISLTGGVFHISIAIISFSSQRDNNEFHSLSILLPDRDNK